MYTLRHLGVKSKSYKVAVWVIFNLNVIQTGLNLFADVRVTAKSNLYLDMKAEI